MPNNSDSPTTQELLNAAIVAAKGRQPGEARALLRRVLAQDPDNISAWLWMSGVIKDPLKREACLRKVLELDPEHPAARRGLARTSQDAAAYLLRRGIAAARAGELTKAHKLLTDVVMREEQNLEAWTWLARVVESNEDREVCYDNILTLDPENQEAQVGLAVIEQERAIAGEGKWESGDAEGERIASTLAGDILGDAYREKYTTDIPEPEPEPASPAQELWAKYEDPHRCPYCAAETLPKDRRCPNCRHRLWINVRARDQRSTLLWILIALQATSTAIAATIPFLAVMLAGYQAGLTDSAGLFGAYVGTSQELPAATLDAVHAILPPFLFWILWVPALFGLVITVGLFFRWPIIFYGLLASAVLGLVSSLGGLAFAEGNLVTWIAGIFGIGMALVNVVITLKLEDDFKVHRHRLELRLDPGMKTGLDYLRRGRDYAARKMWALATLHFRRSAAMLPTQVDGLSGLAHAAIQMGDLALAQWALETGLERVQNHPKLQAALEALQERTEASEA